jgi:hypothetical protein
MAFRADPRVRPIIRKKFRRFHKEEVQLHLGNRREVVQELFLRFLDPKPEALTPTFETRFARMEPSVAASSLSMPCGTRARNGCVSDDLSVDECMKAIQDDPWFVI